MRRVFKNKKILLLIIPFVLAIWGVNYGLPMHLIGDEESLIGGTLLMLQTKQLIPALNPDSFGILYYPPVIPYLLILANLPVLLWNLLVNNLNVTATIDALILNMNGIWISSRLLAAIFATGTVAVVFKLSKFFYKNHSAWLSSALVATSFLHVMLAHSSRHWVYAVFFAYLTVLLSLYLVRAQLKKKWLLGLVAGIGFGASNISIFGFVSALVVLIYHRHRVANLAKVIWKNVIIFAVVGGTLTLFNIQEILRILARERTGEAKTLTGFVNQLGEMLQVLWGQELIITALALLSLIFIKHRKRHRLFTFSISVLYGLFVYLVFHFESRYVYLLVPALAIIGADALYLLTKKVKHLFAAISVLLLVYPASVAIQYNHLMTHPDTRELAINYVSRNIDEAFILSSSSINLDRSKQSLERAMEFGTVNARERHTLNNYDRLAGDLGKGYNYQNIHFWNEENYTIEKIDEYLEEFQAKYFIVEYWDLEDLDEIQNHLRQNRGIIEVVYDQDSHGHDPLDINGDFRGKGSDLFDLHYLGPIVEIYKL